MTPLHGHTSPETAYVVDDYPYGFRLRCRIRYWLDTDPMHPKTKRSKGTRFVSQTTNPKIEGREVWNKPKASTYALLAGGMYLDEAGHVQWTALTEYSSAEEVKTFLETWPEWRDALRSWCIAKARLSFGLVKANEKGESGFTINGEMQPASAGDLERNRRDLATWLELGGVKIKEGGIEG